MSRILLFILLQVLLWNNTFAAQFTIPHIPKEERYELAFVKKGASSAHLVPSESYYMEEEAVCIMNDKVLRNRRQDISAQVTSFISGDSWQIYFWLTGFIPQPEGLHFSSLGYRENDIPLLQSHYSFIVRLTPF